MSGRLSSRLQSMLRLYHIYCEAGCNPWRVPRKARRADKEKAVSIGVGEAMIPFLNDDAKRTFAHLLLRPGRMMRDYIFRGEHERYLAPFTALLVFYSVITLLLAVVTPGASGDSITDKFLNELKGVESRIDFSTVEEDTAEKLRTIIKNTYDAVVLTRLDLYPESVDAPWKESLAAIEGDIRSKGIPLFIGGFVYLWLAMAILLRKYKVSLSGAAAASGYVMCQICLFMLFVLLLTWGKESDVGIFLSAVLLFIDYRQLLGIRKKTAFWLTVKTGIVIFLLRTAMLLLISLIFIIFAVLQFV